MCEGCTHSNLCTSKAGTSVQPDTVATCRSIDFNLARIRLEIMCGVFGRDTALDCEASFRNCFLGEAELRKGTSSGDLDLGGHNINASNFLCARQTMRLYAVATRQSQKVLLS